MTALTIPRGQTFEKLVIMLWKNPDGSIFTRSVEVIDKVSRVRFSFNNNSSLKDVFTPDAVKCFASLVQVLLAAKKDGFLQ